MWDPKVFGRAILTARKSQGWTQEQLGDRVGVSAQAVSKWENGESCPDVALLPQVCAALEASADDLLGLEHNQGADALLRGLRERLDRMGADERPRRAAAMVGRLLLHLTDERVDEWAGEDFLTAGRASEQVLHAASLLTRNGSVLHIHGTGDFAAPEVSDDAIARGIGIFADPMVIAVLRRLVPDGRHGAAVAAQARADEGVRATCARLVESGYLELHRDGYVLTGPGLLIAATILVLAEVPGLEGTLRRVRRQHMYQG